MIKRLSKTPELEYFDENANKVVDVEIGKVVPEKGIAVKYPGSTNSGFIHWFEIGYGSVGRFENIYKQGYTIKAVVSEFDAEKNSLKFSIKRQFTHQFDEWAEAIDDNSTLNGKVVGYFENSAHIELTQNGYTVQAFILESLFQILPLSKVKIYLITCLLEKVYFYIFEINEDRKTISLVRTKYLEQFEEPNYGEKSK
ncbi:MAG: hypothetical protein IPH96_00565 [Saprospiraceae bacterium]|nr:hypothetical protein [Saprospiraceae bacterium]